MNRKNTILIAVFINAGLLVVLSIAALTSSEESIAASPLLGDASNALSSLEMEKSFYERSIELPIPKSSQTPFNHEGSSENSSPLIQPALLAEEPLVHKLPPLAPEIVQAPAPVASSAPPAPLAVDPPFAEIVVKKGDNLEKIAKVHHVSVDEIIKINHLPSSFLRVGQILKIPSRRMGANSSKPKESAVEKKNSEAGDVYYTVKVGDNPWTIATKNQIKVEELIRLNGLNEEKARKLKPGDRLRIR